MSDNATIAGATLSHLVGVGVRDFVICAGARNVPLVATLLEVAEKHGLRLWRHFDERAASYFALGLAKRSGDPVVVCTTSGTAAAELLPATIEAHYSGIPLVLVTADRPERFRGSGAPQAIEQPELFGHYVAVRMDVQDETDLSWLVSWGKESPCHLNVCFEEPGPDDRADAIEPIAVEERPPAVDEEDAVRLEAFVAEPRDLLVLLGELPESWRDPVVKFLSRLRVPFWAEATSGLREREELAPFRVETEKEVAAREPRHVLRIGGVPSLRFWRDLEERGGIEVLTVSRRGLTGLARESRILRCFEFPQPPELPHTGPIQQGSVADSTLLNDPKASESELAKLLDRHPASEPAMVRALSREIPSEALVYLGNSLPIREWNLAACFEVSHPEARASRGANGIDGQIATFLGLSRDESESWCLVGDLTALYDLNAPALLEQLPSARRRIVILNNGGGRIFSRLPSMAGLPEKEKRVTENRHETDFESWAAMWGLAYRRWSGGEPFPEIEDAAVVIEAVPDEAETEAFWGEWR